MLSSFAVGKELYDAYQAGENPTVSMTIDAEIEDRFFPQVLAETPGGNPNKVVVAGAHLDSVLAGPGVNDDGSGTSAQLEIAKQIARKDLKPRQQIRFMWFGGEEEGLVGSQYYAEHLTPAEASKIMVMIDIDMISSPNFARFVYDGDGSEPGNPAGPPGSGEVERVFADFWESQGLSSEKIPFDGRSDYVGFTNLGIPAGGIFAGAEVPKTEAQVAIYGGAADEQYDPCYHDFCDRLRVDPRFTSAGGARRPARSSGDGGRRRALDAPVPAGDDSRDLAFRQGEEPAARPRDELARDPQASRSDDEAKLAVQVPGPPAGATALTRADISKERGGPGGRPSVSASTCRYRALDDDGLGRLG